MQTAILSLLVAAVAAQSSTKTCSNGVSAYCNGASGSTNIIERCENGQPQPGNCNDNLSGSLQQGQLAVCVENGNSAQCVAKPISSSTLTSSASSTAYPGVITPTCPAGVTAYCQSASGSSNIITRCHNGTATLGNCNDNLAGVLTTGQTAVCVSDGSNNAKCEAVPIANTQPATVSSELTGPATPTSEVTGPATPTSELTGPVTPPSSQVKEPSATVSILTGAATMNGVGLAAVVGALFAALI